MNDDLVHEMRLVQEKAETLRKAWYRYRDYLEKNPDNETLKKRVNELKEKYMDLVNEGEAISKILRRREERIKLEENKKRSQNGGLQVYLDGDVAHVIDPDGQTVQEDPTVKPKVIQGKKLSDFKETKSKKIDEKNSFGITYIGGKHFRPNNLNSEYAVFKKDGYIHVVGNFTSDWLRDNYIQLVGDMANDKDIKSIKLWNRLENGDTPLDGFDAKVRVNNNGNIEIIGNVDNLEYHNQFLGNDLGERKEGKHFKSTVTSDISDDVQDKENVSSLNSISKIEDDEKDMSGLDVIPDGSDFVDLSNGAEEMVPVRGRKITRKKAKPSLIKRGIEKFKGLKNWQKVAIVAGVIVIVGVGVFVVGPQIMNGINHLLNPENVNVANQVTQATATVQDTASQVSQSIDYSSMGGAGHTVFSNAADAANNVNGVVSNQWFSNNPVDVFNTATNSYMGLTPDQLNDPNLLAELAKDPNNTMLFGNSISDPSGFIGLDDVVNTVTKIR